ncbi:hypothetical protein [Spirosoma endbachense]|uniref:Uncharacterized protein n=1 Tax=Spirosoma endbachense TaxID=2666025 RepID=A0A6P1W3Z0_9BACT|nr:hypothetical protein [Spirosoma endbachense]QHV99268.1 hypothetical protein GJR95_31525 [Spirosoma endbachense]
MKLTFDGCKRINLDRDGLDLIYFYRINDDPAVHRIHTVSTHYRAWSINEAELIEHSKQVFYQLILMIRVGWPAGTELPDEVQEYHEGIHFGSLTADKLDWKGYSLELTED